MSCVTAREPSWSEPRKGDDFRRHEKYLRLRVTVRLRTGISHSE